MADPQDRPDSEPDSAPKPPAKKATPPAAKKAVKAPAKKAPAKKAAAKKAPAKKAPAKKPPAKKAPGVQPRAETNGQLTAAAKDAAAQAKSTVDRANNPLPPETSASSPLQSPLPLVVAITLSLLALLLVRQLRRH
ncbi:hypothetical protein MSIMFB_05511 [Mycobacterium simulans]|uniref:Nucleoid-structuring protein H-NS n=1 Tax=Mycobacterium simulans TaxID=627089 RepID=A0A7Z7ISN6_9MYCO|nr:nucleoid-structuring protein H-NS [Mycobacterium simulans]SOJ58030.1 hypothetical protein MSIMFB_05511 [Mycobacterium simulans]